MIVAEIVLLSNHGWVLPSNTGQHIIKFDCLEAAKSEYLRIVDLMKRYKDKANDLPTMLEVVGTASKVSLPLEDVRSVALGDYAAANSHHSGLRETFPNLFP